MAVKNYGTEIGPIPIGGGMQCFCVSIAFHLEVLRESIRCCPILLGFQLSLVDMVVCQGMT